MLKCNKCNKEKPKEDFYYTGLGKRKYQYSCKLCTKQREKSTYSGKRLPKFKKGIEKSLTPQHKHLKSCKYRDTKEKIPRVYFMYEGNTIAYIGLSKYLSYRIKVHKNESPFFKNISSIRYTTLSSPVEMALLEIIFINHYKPKYNKHIYLGNHSFPIPDLAFEDWPLP